jgi:hypothetical protein
MAGHRDDGTFAEDKSKGRSLDKTTYFSQFNDDAPASGMPRPDLDEVLDPWDPEDVEEEQTLKEERLKKGHY